MNGTMNPSGGMPGAGAVPRGGNAITNNLSVANPTDAAYMIQSGQITKDMSMKDYLEQTYKLPITSPVAAFASAIVKQQQSSKPMGKMQALAGAQGRPTMVQAPSSPVQRMGGAPQAGGGLEDLMNRTGGM